jgi:hypothetical protein
MAGPCVEQLRVRWGTRSRSPQGWLRAAIPPRRRAGAAGSTAPACRRHRGRCTGRDAGERGGDQRHKRDECVPHDQTFLERRLAPHALLAHGDSSIPCTGKTRCHPPCGGSTTPARSSTRCGKTACRAHGNTAPIPCWRTGHRAHPRRGTGRLAARGTGVVPRLPAARHELWRRQSLP